MPRVRANSKSVSFVTFASIIFSERLKTEADNLFDIRNHIQSEPECEWKHRRGKPMQRGREEKYIRVRKKKKKQSKGGNRRTKEERRRMATVRWIHGVNTLSLSQVVRTSIYLAAEQRKRRKRQQRRAKRKKRGGRGVRKVWKEIQIEKPT